ncbi:putative nuclease HARBI1 [Episyrphus balteatus]|uniref:putative nuclease HARBI1 n=1 Tax=Episyrphus balteatus TaxID=286459 RepID=UPI0024869323|nr:putative nuclease HARBI1 [Episyrphus balteatus]
MVPMKCGTDHRCDDCWQSMLYSCIVYLFEAPRSTIRMKSEVVCDANQRVTDVVARWRGSSHDSRIWRESSIYRRLQSMDLQGGVILGDGGYPGSKILLTPFRISATLSEPERRYNRSHIRTRNHIERLFGQIKNKFRCYFNGIQLNYGTAKASIVAICILHNISKDSLNVGFLDDSDINMPDDDDQNDDDQNDDDGDDDPLVVLPGRRLTGVITETSLSKNILLDNKTKHHILYEFHHFFFYFFQ